MTKPKGVFKKRKNVGKRKITVLVSPSKPGCSRNVNLEQVIIPLDESRPIPSSSKPVSSSKTKLSDLECNYKEYFDEGKQSVDQSNESYGWYQWKPHANCRGQFTWRRNQPNWIPPRALPGGRDVDGTPLYVGRAMHEGDLLPAKVRADGMTAYVSYGGREFPEHQFEECLYVNSKDLTVIPAVVIDTNYKKWPDKPRCGKTEAGYEGFYCILETATYYLEECFSFVDISVLPKPALMAGGTRILGSGVCIKNKEFNRVILASHHVAWQHSSNGEINNQAMVVGNTRQGEPLYAGRAWYNGSITLGKPLCWLHYKHSSSYPYHGELFPKYMSGLISPPGPLAGHLCITFVRSATFGLDTCSKTHCLERCFGYKTTIIQPKNSWLNDKSVLVHPSHKCLYIPFNGQEIRINEYEIMLLL
ncbi:hypothetical protein J6590_062579 [Homalodisca vitripennis]|nr:hypothetical protein J6590_062579 [Homalodisca vitripennis]